MTAVINILKQDISYVTISTLDGPVVCLIFLSLEQSLLYPFKHLNSIICYLIKKIYRPVEKA